MPNKNLVFCILGAIVNVSVGIIQFSIVANYLPQESVGKFSLVNTWLMFIIALSAVSGIRTVITRELCQANSSRQRKKIKIFSSGVIAEVSMSLMALIVVCILVNSFEYFRDIRTELIVSTLIMYLGFITMVNIPLAHSDERLGLIMLSTSVGRILSTLVLAYLAFQKYSLVWICGVIVGWRLIASLILISKYNLKNYIDLKVANRVRVSSYIKSALPVAIMIIITQLYVRVDVLMIDYFEGKSSVAIYTASYRFLDVLMVLSGSLMFGMLPNFAKTINEDRKKFNFYYKKILLIFLKFLVPIAIIIAVFSETIILNLYGSDYLLGKYALKILMLAAVFAWLNGPSGTIFISLKKEGIYTLGTLVGLVFNIIGNYLLIPIYSINGAAFSTVVTEAVLSFWSLFYIRRFCYETE